MPVFQVNTNVEVPEEKRMSFLKAASQLISSETNKPEDYVCVQLKSSLDMIFGGSDLPCAFVKLYSLNFPDSSASKVSKAICEIYSGKDIVTKILVAIKVERTDVKRSVLKLEVMVLKKLQVCPYVARFIGCGQFGDHNYLVMELLGDNLGEIRRKFENFSMSTVLKLGIFFVKSLEQMHSLGYIHRDIKPSNYVIGFEGHQGDIFLIDFGLSRKYVDQEGNIRPAREQSGFRGTARYASINSHLSRDLGRCDDLWSVFYILIEFAVGFLPWRELKDKDEIKEMKIKFNIPELVSGLPPEFLKFMDYLKGLKYEDKPDYDYLIGIMNNRYKLLGGTNSTLYDWEYSLNNNRTNINSEESILSAGGCAPQISNEPEVPNSEEILRQSVIFQNQNKLENSPIYKLVAGYSNYDYLNNGHIKNKKKEREYGNGIDQDENEGVYGLFDNAETSNKNYITYGKNDPFNGSYASSEFENPFSSNLPVREVNKTHYIRRRNIGCTDGERCRCVII